MNKNERITLILNELQNRQSVSVKDLSARFNISEMTIRRDLNELSEQYNITRTHGGAILPNKNIVRTLSFDKQQISHLDDKLRIAERAVELISPGQRIYIDVGSTTRPIVQFFNNNMNNVIVTNSLDVAEEVVQYNSLSVVMLGGEIVPLKKCTSGDTVEEQLMRYRLDIAFLGAAAIGTDGRLYDEFTPDAQFKKSIFSVSEKVILLADSSKLNTYQLSSFGKLEDVDTIVTDSGISPEGLELLDRYHVHVILV